VVKVKEDCFIVDYSFVDKAAIHPSLLKNLSSEPLGAAVAGKRSASKGRTPKKLSQSSAGGKKSA
jgi:hypothetical protein